MLLCVLAVPVTVWLTWLFLKGRTAWDALEGTAVTAAAALADGQVQRVCGTVTATGAPLRSPLQGKSCIYARLTVVVDGREEVRERASPFSVEDASGKVAVAAGRWDVLCASSFKSGPAPGAPLPAAVQEVVALLSPDVRPGEWREEVISPGDAVTVLGALDAASSQLTAPPGGALLLSNVERMVKGR